MHPNNLQPAEWWSGLEEQWQRAFNEAILRRGPVTATPSTQELDLILTAPALRFAGPRAHYPNMSFELTNLSGLSGLTKVEILVVNHQEISTIEELAGLLQLKSLYLLDNRIEDLHPLRKLVRLEELNFPQNKVKSLKPLENLTALRVLYCSENLLASLDGISVKHRGTLKSFHVIPNENLPDHEIMKFERKIGIRCLKG